MKVDVIAGLQWGDEGKGKIVDLLSSNYDIIARFQGGPNAGHTIIVNGTKYVLHQIPSGMTREGVMNVIGNSVVLDPIILQKEIASLENVGIEVRSRLLVSRRANLIIPGHRLLDSIHEKNIDGKVGSTLKGIGPTYQDKTGRFGLRVGDLFSPDFKAKYNRALERHKCILRGFGHEEAIDDKAWLDAAEGLKTLQMVDNEYYINNALKDGKKILAEGAQGTLLDIDFGSYPYVTSSNTISAAVCTGLGISPKKIGKVFGIFKAYATRVGDGPFPTELNDAMGENLRQKGHEFGSTTGRPRRTGWLDLKALEYACMLNGVDELFMMKIDVMNDLDEVKIATSYKGMDGKNAEFAGLAFGENVEAQYSSMPGWKKDLTAVREFNDLPETVKNYITYIEKQVSTPISIISVGPERSETIYHNS